MWYSWRERHFPVRQLMYAESMTTMAETTINQDSDDNTPPVVRRLLTEEATGEDVAFEPDDNASINSMPGRGPGRKMGDSSSKDESMSHANANFDDDSDFGTNHVAFRVRVLNDLEPDDYSIGSELSDPFLPSDDESDQSMPGLISREERDQALDDDADLFDDTSDDESMPDLVPRSVADQVFKEESSSNDSDDSMPRRSIRVINADEHGPFDDSSSEDESMPPPVGSGAFCINKNPSKPSR